MRSSSRLTLAVIAAVAGIGISGASGASIQQRMDAGGPMPVIAGIGKTTRSQNRRAPGAHKAARRSAHKLRRVKAHKARNR